MRRFLASLLLLAAAAPASAVAPPATHVFHIRITRGSEVLVERDMLQIAYLGSVYSRTWTDFARGACPGRTLSWQNRIFVRLDKPAPPQHDRAPWPAHAILLSVETGAAPTLDDCAAAPALNEISLSHILVLEPGRPARLEGGGIVVEVTRR